jgi:glutathione S-transferase
MNLKAHFPNFKVWSRAQADIQRITTIWKECLATYGGPFLFGERTMADAMYAPVITRFITYDVKLEPICAAYSKRIMAMPEMKEWIAAAQKEPEDIDELDVEF